ncbi:TPA: terminase small subunit [Mannheimia haemolytica]
MKKPLKLTPKQENFCWKYIEMGNAAKAYREAYEARFMLDDSIYVEASRLLNSPKITQRLNEIKAEIASEQKTDLTQILFELEQARMLAQTKRDVQGMVKATTEKARILGLDKLKAIEKKLSEL